MAKKLPIKAEYWYINRHPIDALTDHINSIMIDNLDDADIVALIAGKSTPRTKSLGKKIQAAKKKIIKEKGL